MAMVPHERSLVERFKDKPFVLLGVNADSTVYEFRRVQESKKINWRSWWDGSGRIAAEFRIQGFPTVYLIDHEGTIRQSGLGHPPEAELENAIKRLIQEAEEDRTRKTAAGARTGPAHDS